MNRGVDIRVSRRVARVGRRVGTKPKLACSELAAYCTLTGIMYLRWPTACVTGSFNKSYSLARYNATTHLLSINVFNLHTLFLYSR